jgi:predicted RNA-binding Zn-ribbon protein involved in translation (DUF1610 family)
MDRYPRAVRDAGVKCIGCNAPVAVTVAGRYVCVECGESLVKAISNSFTVDKKRW